MALCNSKSATHFRIQQSQPVLFLRLTIFVFVPFPFANSVFFENHNFQLNDPSMSYQGDATPFNTNIELTYNTQDMDPSMRIGRASYTTPVHLWDSETGNLTDFSTWFRFNITPYNNTYLGDGFTFFLSPYNASIPVNPPGGLLGLFNSTVLDHTNSHIVAVEFDTKQDPWDPCPYHIGIDVNSIESITYTQLDDILANGTAAYALVIYDSTTKTLQVSLSYDGRQTFRIILSYVIDLRNVLPEWVSVGFSASLGTSSIESHTITSWQFNSSLSSVGYTSNSTSGGLPSTITGHKTNPHLEIYLPVGIIGSSSFGVGLFLFIMKKKKKKNDSPIPQVHDLNQAPPQTLQGSPQEASREKNTNTSAGAIGNRNGTIGSTNTGGDVAMKGYGPQLLGNTIYNNNYNVVLPPVSEEKGLLEKKA